MALHPREEFRHVRAAEDSPTDFLVFPVLTNESKRWLLFLTRSYRSAAFVRKRLEEPPVDWWTMSDAELIELWNRADVISPPSPGDESPGDRAEFLTTQLEAALDRMARLSGVHRELQEEVEVLRTQLTEMNVENQRLFNELERLRAERPPRND